MGGEVANEENLRPMGRGNRSESEEREMRSKGGRNSGATRRRKRDARKIMEGVLKSVDGRQFVVTVTEKQKVEGKKRPQLVEVEKQFSMDEVKYCKYLINFK